MHGSTSALGLPDQACRLGCDYIHDMNVTISLNFTLHARSTVNTVSCPWQCTTISAVICQLNSDVHGKLHNIIINFTVKFVGI